ncbi:protein phosphatase regulator [Entomophthora muscae]|uniref:Protein phosphatase regulator n=1 Tax=Entomophthora muscae TaxID=34485 RepID=A0ACC2TBN8_9FUNG|nr:protein phosphatase regulator [Entomophthora muscae]
MPLMERNELDLQSAKLSYGSGCVSTGAGWETRMPTNDAVDGPSAPPSVCVDYLTHNWEDEDLARSWRAVARQHGSGVNCARLENASWRIWNKKRNNIPTLNPAELNWHKDNDTTWLYGPLLSQPKQLITPPVSKSASFCHSVSLGLKPALKKRTSLQHLRKKVTIDLPRPKLRFNTQVEQYMAVEPAALPTSIVKIADTRIKSEYSPLVDLDDFDAFLSYKVPTRFPRPPPEPTTTTQMVQKCYDAANTTYNVFNWARSLIF